MEINLLYCFAFPKPYFSDILLHLKIDWKCLAFSALKDSQKMAIDLEERMRSAEQERYELEEAQRKAEDLRQRAEAAANLEKEERERKVGQEEEECKEGEKPNFWNHNLLRAVPRKGVGGRGGGRGRKSMRMSRVEANPIH